jgi:glycosyltransferase involved in cell wall biosynthesis
VLFVSHCDFTGSSAYHVYRLASALAERGWSPAIAIPGSPRGVRELGRPTFPVLSVRDLQRGRLTFPDGAPADLVHAVTPRNHVRSITLEASDRYGAPYLVHLEDNEAAVRASLAGNPDEAGERGFLAAAAGVSVVVERLLELTPAGVPSVVIRPGYDDQPEATGGLSREEARRTVGIEADELAVVYTGNVHEANLAEVSELYAAVERLRAAGMSVLLVKTGWNSVAPPRLPGLGEGLRDLGWIGRGRLRELIRSADVFVQPGAPGPFNDYRFPSKLPDWLASGHPVVLPRTNLGLELSDGREAILLDKGDADEIATAVAALADPDVRRRIGAGGRAFALRALRWSAAADALEALYGATR